MKDDEVPQETTTPSKSKKPPKAEREPGATVKTRVESLLATTPSLPFGSASSEPNTRSVTPPANALTPSSTNSKETFSPVGAAYQSRKSAIGRPTSLVTMEGQQAHRDDHLLTSKRISEQSACGACVLTIHHTHGGQQHRQHNHHSSSSADSLSSDQTRVRHHQLYSLALHRIV